MYRGKEDAIIDFMSAGLKAQMIASVIVPLFVVSLVRLINKANEYFSRKLPLSEQPKKISSRVYLNAFLIIFAVMIAMATYSNLTRGTPHHWSEYER